MKLDDFFGVDIDKYPYETNRVLDFLGLRRTIEKTSQVSSLTNAFDANSQYVEVAKRQQLLLFFNPLLSKEFLPYDKHYYTKDVNTGTDKDRRYNAEDRLLRIVLSVVTGERYSALVDKEFKPDIAALRSANRDSEERHDRLKQILSDQTSPILEQFKVDKKKVSPQKTGDKSFFAKLFNK